MSSPGTPRARTHARTRAGSDERKHLMANAHLLRDEAPLPDVLKLKGPPTCMSAKAFAKQKGPILQCLRTRTDPPPRLMQAGAGAPGEWHARLLALLERADATVVRGFKLYKLPVDLAYWKTPAWLATTHVLVATVSESGNVVYTDPSASEDSPYIFVPSDRAHRDLTTEQLLSGQWLAGSVVGGSSRFCQAFAIHEQVHGRHRSVVGVSPEELKAKRNVFVRMMPHFVEWYRARGYTNGTEVQAELMGAPVYNVGTEVDEQDTLAAYTAMTENKEAYVNGVLGFKLELKCRQKLMRGELSIGDVRDVFFAHFDSCAQLVRAAQAQQLTERLQECGFNTLYS